MEIGYSLTNKQLTSEIERIFDLTVVNSSLGPQFYYDAWSKLRVQDVSLNPLHEVLYIDMSLNVTVPHAEGRLYWNIDDHTLEINTDVSGVNLQVGQEQLARARNISGGPIIDGQPVFVIGSSGQRPTIGLSNSSSVLTSMTTLGIATQTIGNNNTGYINTFGLVREIDTSTFAEGSILWVDTVDGGLTTIRPAPPAFQYAIGIVIRSHQSQGSIFVRPTLVPRLAWLSDVSARDYQHEKDILKWNSDVSIWEPTSVVAIFAPSSTSDAGTQGDLSADASYLYICTSTNTWGRVLLDYIF